MRETPNGNEKLGSCSINSILKRHGRINKANLRHGGATERVDEFMNRFDLTVDAKDSENC
jgi:hypothetical protein